MVSLAGSQMQVWALFWHIRTITPEPIALGGVGLARIFPIILFSLVGGAVADSLNRRNLLFITQTALALSAAALALLTFSGVITLWQIYLITAIQAVAMAFDGPARQSLVPNLVPSEDLPNAFSLTSMAMQVGAIVGPAASGFVIAHWGQAYTYLINAISFFAVILALIFMGRIPQQADPTKHRVVSLLAIKEGLRFIFKHEMIFSTMLLDFIATFFSSANTLLPIFTRDVLHVGVIEYGWLSASQSIGAVIAALYISQKKEVRRQGLVFIIAIVLFGITTVVFGMARGFWLAFIALAGIGAADTVNTIIRNTIRQLQTPDYIRGRMISINQIFFMGGPQLGEVEAGAVAQFFGAPIAIISGGIGCIIAVAWTVKRWPFLLKYNGDEPIVAGT